VKLVESNDPVLREISAPVTSIAQDVKPYVAHMKKIMRKNKGVGLAAPQVGICSRFFITRLDKSSLRTVINPTWNPVFEGLDSIEEEGCLSFPGRRVKKKRHVSIDAEWTDAQGRVRGAILVGYEARVFQHETDHLNGICIFD